MYIQMVHEHEYVSRVLQYVYKYVHLYVPVHTCVFRGQVMADLGLGT